MEKLSFEEWKSQLVLLISSAGYKPNLEDDDMLFIAYDMEDLTPEEAAAQFIEAEKEKQD